MGCDVAEGSPLEICKKTTSIFKSRPPYQVEINKGNGCARGWCVGIGNLLQDGLPVKLRAVKFKDPKFKHEIFVALDMKHSYFSNISILIDLFVVSCLCIIFVIVILRNFKVTNLTLYMYLFIDIS